MDFAGCAAAARDEVAVLVAHEPPDVAGLTRLRASVPRRRSGFLVARKSPRGAGAAAAFPFRFAAKPRRSFFVLSTGHLRWYDEANVHSNRAGGSAATLLDPGAPAGQLRLRGSMTVKFRHEQRSFSVIEGDGPAILWVDAPDHREMEQWCIARSRRPSRRSFFFSGMNNFFRR